MDTLEPHDMASEKTIALILTAMITSNIRSIIVCRVRPLNRKVYFDIMSQSNLRSYKCAKSLTKIVYASRSCI
jgi:hypothetical protein